MIDQQYASISNTLIYSAMFVYMVAFVAYATDLSVRGAGARSLARRTQAADERLLVTAGGGSEAGGGSGTTVLRPETDAVPAAAFGHRGGVGARSDRGGEGARLDPPTGPLRTRAGNVAVSLTYLAFALHLGGVVARGLSAHRVPWGNMYEFSTSGSMVVTAVFIAVMSRRDVRYLGSFVIGPVLLTLGLAVTVLYTASAPLVPALQSFWLVIHVSVAFVASALFTLGFSTSVLQVVQERRELARAAGRSPRWRASEPGTTGGSRLRSGLSRIATGDFMDALPSSVDLERSAYRIHVVAFPMWTFTLIAGAIWAEAAWGRYWGWDPKEVWTFVIWVVYAGYLHARATRGWDGRRAAFVSMAGYACILFNFLVVNVYFVGFHSYGGVAG